MTDTFITQCPHCQTSFRLKHSQLTAARGSVRCGACMQVFNAASQITSTASPAAQPPVSTSSLNATVTSDATASPALEANPAPDNATKQPLMIHDDMDLDDLDDLDLDEELARLELEEQQRAHQITEEFANLQADPQANPEPDFETIEGLNATAQNDWSDELLAQEPVAQLCSAIPDSSDEPTSDEQVLTEPSTPSRELKMPRQPIAMEPSADHLPHFADEPLRLDWQPKKSRWKRWLGWGLLNTLALLLLLGQYTYHNFTELARQDSTRPWLEILCPLIDCKLPSKVDVQQIKSSNLLVRSHPEFSGALLVDAIIYNRASFTQPFPLLELNFTDLNNQLVARRLFKPLEYLDGELAGQKHMPPQVPIHIALEILEPSGGAINYTINFVSPE
ncbi:MAG TPA: DUF3426 domain-containing protein [Gammaproteobacteria bacterium]|nr:DUF3426 domain-containing protein [Gammaproteobacteria bacterium]